MEKTIWIDRDGPNRSLGDDIAYTEALLADMKRFSSKQFPTSRELESAFLLDDYKIEMRKFPILTGRPSERRSPVGKRVLSDPLVAIAPTLGWARTQTSFIRLGFPFDVA